MFFFGCSQAVDLDVSNWIFQYDQQIVEPGTKMPQICHDFEHMGCLVGRMLFRELSMLSDKVFGLSEL